MTLLLARVQRPPERGRPGRAPSGRPMCSTFRTRASSAAPTSRAHSGPGPQRGEVDDASAADPAGEPTGRVVARRPSPSGRRTPRARSRPRPGCRGAARASTAVGRGRSSRRGRDDRVPHGRRRTRGPSTPPTASMSSAPRRGSARTTGRRVGSKPARTAGRDRARGRDAEQLSRSCSSAGPSTPSSSPSRVAAASSAAVTASATVSGRPRPRSRRSPGR